MYTAPTHERFSIAFSHSRFCQVAHAQPCDPLNGVKAVFHKTLGVGVGFSSQLVFAKLQRNLMKPVSDFLCRDCPCHIVAFLAYVVLIE